MYASITTYRRGELVIDVLPGRSHSAAWAAVTSAAAREAERPRELGAIGARRARGCARRRHQARRGDAVVHAAIPR